MTLRLKLVVAALAMLVVALMLPTAAYADPTSLTFILNVNNIGATNPVAQAVFTFDSGHIDVTVTGLSGSTLFGNGAGSGMFGFSSSNSGLILGGFSNGASLGSSGTMDGYGLFNYHVNGGAGMANAVSSFSFTISQAGGFSQNGWVSALGIHINDAGYSMAVHFFQNGFTGFGSTTDQNGCPDCSNQITPEPTSMFLLGTGLIGMGGVLRRKMKR